MSTEQKQQAIRCSLSMTKNAQEGIQKWVANEQTFFALGPVFDVYIEKQPLNRQGNHSYSFYFDPETNAKLGKKLESRVAVMQCVLKPDGLLATGFHVRGTREAVRTNRRHQASFEFKLNNPGTPLPASLHMTLNGLPVAEERSEYVKKQVESWEGYLQIAESQADVEDIHCSFSAFSFSGDFTKVRLDCKGLKSKNWKRLQGFSVKLENPAMELGQITDANKSRQTIEVELKKPIQKSARETNRLPAPSGKITLSNFASLSQIRRLRKGFRNLEDGLAANANLEKILFAERPLVRIDNKKIELDFHNNLNEYQREAVSGAMNANDLYVIQGPPGTGKTTVISEICYQNVKAGLRTLVASQSNLAVDNALGRLLADPSIRILRYGRTESIEEEGKKFIEENVALHWRDGTLRNVRSDLQMTEQKQTKLRTQIAELRAELEQMNNKRIELEAELDVQHTLAIEHDQLRQEIVLKESALHQLQERLVISENSLAQLKQEMDAVNSEASELNNILENGPSAKEVDNKKNQLNEELKKLEQLNTLFDFRNELQKVEERLASANERKPENKNEYDSFENLNRRLPGVQKVDELQHLFEEHGVEIPLDLSLDISEMNRVGKGIIPLPFQMDELGQLHGRLQNAISKVEQVLSSQQYPLNQIPSLATSAYGSVSEMNEMIDKIGRFLISPKIKQLLSIQGPTEEKNKALQKIAKNLAHLYGKNEEVIEMGHTCQSQMQLRQEVKSLFIGIKKDARTYLLKSLSELSDEEEALKQNIHTLTEQKTAISTQLKDIALDDGGMTETELESQLDTVRSNIITCDERLGFLKRTQDQLHSVCEKLKRLNADTLEAAHNTALLIEEERTASEQLQTVSEKLENVESKLNPSIETELNKLSVQLADDKKQLTKMETEQELLPVQLELQKEWETMLAEASAYDLDEIRKLYVEHANVIGTTCVASASKTFMEDYPIFDVVIIDEVSKATPPELLLPMLKGKKVILVGDHHQLPPLIGQETMDEFIQTQESGEQQGLRKLLNESLFERLFRTLPKQNKTMLSIQYRMHERIMETISPFYQEGKYELQCGLPDSDALRDHLLESKTIRRADHLLWLDTPNEPAFFEDKPKGGTSRFNESELELIRTTLQELNSATLEAKAEGRMDQNAKKSVGVISFYGEQVKRINHLIEQELRPEHLHCRTGSVDKFQGMEMDVIILSFVRNHNEPSGDIGFAKDYRRLNVALSRSRELLIIIGSSAMFTERTKNSATREMYRRLLDTVIKNRGLKKVTDRS